MKPIALLDEHPEWSTRLIAELDRRGLPWEKIDHSRHAYDPREREPRYSVVVNRTSPSSHTRGHRGVLFYAEPLLAHYEALGIPVVNPVAAYRFEKSKALQLELFERLGVRHPRAIVANDPGAILDASARLTFPVVVKPNIGGSGAGIVRFDSRVELESAGGALDLGPDHTALVQEYVEPKDGAIVRIEVLDGCFLYAIRIVRAAADRFNLCPADLCQVPAADALPVAEGWEARPPEGWEARPPVAVPAALAACPVTASPGLEVSRCEPPAEAIDAAIRLARAASIDVGGIEYLESKADGRIYFYDVNATSNFVANAPEVLGFDPFPPFVDFILRRAAGGARPRTWGASTGPTDVLGAPKAPKPPNARRQAGEPGASLEHPGRGSSVVGAPRRSRGTPRHLDTPTGS